MIPPAAPAPISPVPAADLPVTPAANTSMSAFDASLSPAALATSQAQSLSGPAQLGQQLMGSLHGYQADLARMQSVSQSLASPPGGATPPAGAAQSFAAPPSQDGSRPMLGLMMQTFDFAIETELVTRAATQFTGSVGTLMKGQ